MILSLLIYFHYILINIINLNLNKRNLNISNIIIKLYKLCNQLHTIIYIFHFPINNHLIHKTNILLIHYKLNMFYYKLFFQMNKVKRFLILKFTYICFLLDFFIPTMNYLSKKLKQGYQIKKPTYMNLDFYLFQISIMSFNLHNLYLNLNIIVFNKNN